MVVVSEIKKKQTNKQKAVKTKRNVHLFILPPGLYFIKVKNILSLKFKNNLIFHFIKELKKNKFLNSFIK